MGLMDKFKNLFTDEEVIEEEDVDTVEIKEVKKEAVNRLPTFMREKIEKEEKKAILKPNVEKVDVELESKQESTYENELPKLEEHYVYYLIDLLKIVMNNKKDLNT